MSGAGGEAEMPKLGVTGNGRTSTGTSVLMEPQPSRLQPRLAAFRCEAVPLQVKIGNPRLCNDDLAKDMARQHAASHIDVRCRWGGRDA
eukprot:2798017-Amphidinium_carterae.1